MPAEIPTTVLSIIERYLVRTAKMADLAFERRRKAEGLNGRAAVDQKAV